MTVFPSTDQAQNQVPPLTGYDVADDPVLLAAAGREGAGWAAGSLHELGRLAGSAPSATRWWFDSTTSFHTGPVSSSRSKSAAQPAGSP